MQTSKQLFAVDIDGTIAGLEAEWLARYNHDYKDNLTAADILSWDIENYVKPGCGKKIFSYLTDDIYDNVQVIDGALEGIEFLRKQFRIIFVTTSVGQVCKGKLRWLKRNGFLTKNTESDYFEAMDKSVFAARFLVDDRPKTIIKFPQTGLLFDQPWNRGEETKNLNRVLDWKDLVAKVASGKYGHYFGYQYKLFA